MKKNPFAGDVGLVAETASGLTILRPNPRVQDGPRFTTNHFKEPHLVLVSRRSYQS
jgi:hypothetical protein